MSDVSNQPSSRAFWLSAAGIVGCFLIFAVLLYVTGATAPRGGSKPAKLSDEDRLAAGLLTPEERTQRLVELRAKEDKILSSYQWVDREKEIVQIPIDRAVELFIEEARANR